MEELKRFIRDIPDFPKKGILFRDITPLLKDPNAFRMVVSAICDRYRDKGVDLVAGIEARGFIFASAIAHSLGCGMVPVRKPGKLPYKTVKEEYELEYGTDAVEIHEDAISPGDKVLVVDDLIATGGTAAATVRLVERLGGKVVGIAFVVELKSLGGRKLLEGYDVTSLIQYD
jgi:adenine phosphoribosyltransferase